MLPRHPDLCTDEDLEAWVRHLVDERVEEGPRLDYKASIALQTTKQRREAAKDISSFANEVGGTLIYGISEDDESPDLALPSKPYGIDPIPGLEEKLENIYVDAIRPTLVEWRIRKIQLSEFPGKVVYLVWTPESWLGPHMVEAHADRRYYRRGQLRAVEMAEHEIRDRYERTMQSKLRAATIVEELETGWMARRFDEPCGSHYLVYPVGLVHDRIDFMTSEVRQWLQANPYPPHGWAPSASGVQTSLLQNPGEPPKGRWEPYARLTRQGAFSVWRHSKVRMMSDPSSHELPDYVPYIAEFREYGFFLHQAAKFLDFIRYSGPIRCRLRMSAARAPVRIPDQWREELRLTYHGDGNPLVVEIDAGASDLIAKPGQIRKLMADKFCQAFGIWDPDWLDAEGEELR